MILKALNDLYPRLLNDSDYEIAKLGYSPQSISFRIVLRPDGSLYEIQDARIKDEKGKLKPDSRIVLYCGDKRGSSPVPFTTWDNALYLLGYPPEKEVEKRGVKEAWEWARERYESSQKIHFDFAEQSQSKYSKIVAQFFKNWSPEDCKDHPILTDVTSKNGTFSILGQGTYFCEDQESLRHLENNNRSNKEEGVAVQQCSITGKTEIEIARLHTDIKGLIGQKNIGPLVSFNASAFESYRKDQSYNAPVSELAAFQYGTALNSLLNGSMSSKHKLRLGDTTCVYWTDQPHVIENFFGVITENGSYATEKAQDEKTRKEVESVLKAIKSGRYSGLIGNTEKVTFHLLGLTPNAARISVRFFYRSTINELLENLHQHHKDLEIIREWDETNSKVKPDPEIPSIRALLSQIRILHRSEENGTVKWKEGKDGNDKFISMLGGAMMRAILNNTPYPEALLSAVIRRVFAERRINYLRASLIKAILTRNPTHKLKHPIKIMLDKENNTASYLQGRLFAILEKIQEEGHKEQTGRSLESTIKDKYFSSACSTPMIIFPRLETLSVHHRRHLKAGRKTQFEKLIGEIKWMQSETPRTLNLENQGIFILGYYHQRKDLFPKKQTIESN